MSNPWFRLYHEFSTDPKIQMMSEANQRRYIMILCLRCSNDLKPVSDNEIAFQLRITIDEWVESKQLFIKNKLIDEENKPIKWDERQYIKEGSVETNADNGNYVYFVGASSLFDEFSSLSVVKIGFSKNPWARLKELQTGNNEELRILATIKTNSHSETQLHDILNSYRKNGEWFKYAPALAFLINKINTKQIKDYEKLLEEAARYVASTVVDTTSELRSTTITTTDTDTDTDIKKKKRFVKPSVEELKKYITEKRMNVDADKFHNFYESKGWLIGKNKMKDWKAACRTWNTPDQSQAQPATPLKELTA